jgi:plastocyanin
MKYFIIFLVLASLVVVIPSSFGECISLPCDDANIKLGEPNYRFIDFSYANTFDDSITFILERIGYGNCTPFIAEIIDEDGNLVWGEGSFALCDPNENPNLITSQIKIGFNEDSPIIINKSGKYLIKVQIDDGSIQREFVVRQNHSGASLDLTVYPVPWMIQPPLKQINLGVDPYQIECKLDFYLVHKYDNTPACVNDFHKIQLLVRGWATFRLNADVVPLENIKVIEGDGYGYLYDSKIIDESQIQIHTWYGNHRLQTLNVGEKIIAGCNSKIADTLKAYVLILTLQQIDIKNKTIVFSGHVENWDSGFCDGFRSREPIGWMDKWNELLINNTDVLHLQNSVVRILEGSASSTSQIQLDPKTITVMLGLNNTVTWINEDTTAHTLVSDKSTWQTEIILPDKESTVIFNQTGVYEYHGAPHPWITGKVIVLENENPESTSIHESDTLSNTEIQQCNSFEELKQKRDIVHCPAIASPRELKIINTQGFTVCQKEENTYYILNAGEQGTITYSTYRGFDSNDPPIEAEQIQLIKEPLFWQEIETPELLSKLQFVPTGVYAKYTSTSQTLGFNDTAILTTTVSTAKDAPSKTMWVGLSPFECHGGTSIRFAVIGEENEN